ncbi:phage tail protein [Serratia ficaria]|uniref:phage tail protein n=1 Tax=Serratia ficaria TaxID=61651 RepID=UPI0021C76CF8|nr:phage tail protein [Serratia ficaria]
MSDKKFGAFITRIGAERLALAALNGTPLAIKYMGVGDGGGLLPTPGPDTPGLINERYQAPLNKLTLSEQGASIIEAEMVMPPQVGGFWLRELALYTEEGECIAISNLPETYKPLLAEGSGRFMAIRMQLKVSSTADVALITDPSVILATVEDVHALEEKVNNYTDEQLGEHERSRNHPDATLKDRGFTQLSNATDSDSESHAATPAAIKAAIAEAVRQAWELDNPVGTSRLFNQNLNPNERWPWSRWEYAGEHLTIRTAKGDGSDVGALGGSDTITVGKSNLPNVQLEVSGHAADTDLGTKKTSGAGRHSHPGKYQESNTSLDGGGSDRRSWSVEYGSKDEGLIGEAPDHQHEVIIGPHGHDVSGKTEALGQGEAITIVERHKLQMLWHRVA